ncbi:MAG: right-handed parallel beta-helix repeat-containing protein [Cyclobacteriaceae bacterium]|nr:right-handed parallel beta-helix repeat-containing protein [Cyclobacteriaceae bacterium]
MKFVAPLSAFVLLFSCSVEKPEPRVWQSMEQSLQTQLITIQDGDTLELPEGNFMFTRSLVLDGKNSVVIRGKGMDKTVLSFKNQAEGAEGLRISNGNNIVLEDFSVEDAKGDNVKVSEVRGITFRRIRSVWSEGPRTENGAYALYPVLCKQVMIEECIAAGSSDAGIYVGQSDSVIIRNNKAYWNVAGIESENSRWVEIYDNEAYDNTGGILIFDLPGLTQYGHSTKVYRNHVHNNNHKNFAAKGNIVASIPPGTGFMILATNTLELTENKIMDNKTVGVGVISYELVAALNEGEVEQTSNIGGVQTLDNNFKKDTLYNPFPYRIKIYNNEYSNSHWFPALGHDIGKLFAMKSFMHPPDVVYDGISDPERPDRQICVTEKEGVLVMVLDAAHDFEGLTKDATALACKDQ